VAERVWAWLQTEKRIRFVPWVLDPQGPDYDPQKAAVQTEKDRLLAELEEVIATASTAWLSGTA
jgi:hypothetical protein